MTYDLQEASVRGGRPYHLYQFVRGGTTTRLVAAPEDVTVGGYTWTASPISHDVVEQSGNIERSALEMELPLDDAFGFGLLQPTYQVMTLTVFRSHYSDGAHQLRQYWKGRLVGARSGGAVIKMQTESIFTSMRRPGCRVRIQRTCRHDLYGIDCTLLVTDFDHAATAAVVSGSALNVAAAAAYPGKLAAGMIIWEGIYGQIEYHNGVSIRMVVEIPGMQAAYDADGPQTITLVEGCNRTLPRCIELGNFLNFGGFHKLPQQNPFNNSIA